MALTDGTTVVNDGIGQWWIILLFLVLFAGGFGGGNAPYVGGEIQNGFNQAALTSGLGDIQNAITSGFAEAEIANNTRQIADMQQMFSIQSSLQNCCCENRSNIADLKYTVATENCADRAALNDGVREIIANQTASTQRILDMMCQDKIDAKNEKIVELQNQLNMANLAASQTAQTAQILANAQAGVVAVEQYLKPTPVPAYVVPSPTV